MRLIDIQIARQARNDARSASHVTETAAPRAAALQIPAFTLRAVAKFLNAILQIAFAAAAKVLRAPLRSGNAYRFRRAFRPGAVKWQRRRVAATILAAAEHSRAPAARQRRKRVVQRETLEATARGDQRGQIPQAALILLPRCENHFRIKFSGGSLRLEPDFLALPRKAHALDAPYVTAPRQAHKRVSSIGR